MKRFFVLASLFTLALAGTTLAAPFFTETFDTYGNGDLTTVSGGNWATTGTVITTPVQVTDGKAVIKEPGGEDVNRYTGGPTLAPGDTWYYALDFSVADKRTVPGVGNIRETYFAMFKDSGTANFRGRLWLTSGSTESTFSLGIAGSSIPITESAGTKWGGDFQFNTSYRVVVSYTASEHDPRPEIPGNPTLPFDGSTPVPNPSITALSGMDGWATLWVDPSSSSSTSITDTTPSTTADENLDNDGNDIGNDLYSPMDSLALRQNGGTTPGPVAILINVAALGNDFNEVYTAIGGVIEEGQPGDFDGDDDVDGRDFLAWQRGESPDPLSAGDLEVWQDNYGVGPLASFAAVPEPGSLCLAAFGLAGILLAKRQR